MRTSRRPTARVLARAATVHAADSPRGDAERGVLLELDAWRARAVPDAAAPLDAEDLVRLFRDCVAALELDAAITSGFTVNTVHYYRRKDIIDPPEGRTAAARYGLRHLWQIAGARLAGHLGLVTLAEARGAIRGADTPALLAFLAARVADARARDAVRAVGAVRAAVATPADDGTGKVRPLPGRARPASVEGSPAPSPAVMIPLPGDAWCVIPASHPARHSIEEANELTRALFAALHAHRTR